MPYQCRAKLSHFIDALFVVAIFVSIRESFQRDIFSHPYMLSELRRLIYFAGTIIIVVQHRPLSFLQNIFRVFLKTIFSTVFSGTTAFSRFKKKRKKRRIMSKNTLPINARETTAKETKNKRI